ncbi:mechanosensitive ion channel family protein [Halobaculum magnesiiphilum]|uniref:Mechanosensitive ion channel family protein n=1 Tax=Halobaculum magnesiiphilum TaxID=1017351 RepID=A0A8T8WBA8_9EURY|nr:mechanosensitive ion channel family protein [Halobaculum magnesiiphilum]QZP37115.1 mechanosensitive ion channel family protein [Halobaculum magnesiiphilum]
MLSTPLQTGVPPIPVPEDLLASGGALVDVVVFAAVTVAVYLLARATVFPLAVRAVRSRNRNNPTIQSATETYLAVLLAAMATVAGMLAAGYGAVFSESALLIAALTFAVGTAGRDVLGSLVSGLFLVADPDFNVGDWIRWSGGEGVVEAVDFRVTRIRTLDYETLTVPNTELTGNTITRPYGRDRFRVTETVHLAYDDDIDRARELIVEAAEAEPRALPDPAPEARVADLGEGTVALRAEFLVREPADGDLLGIRSRFRARVIDRFEEAGITLGPASDRELSGHVGVTVADGDGNRGAGGDRGGDEDRGSDGATGPAE